MYPSEKLDRVQTSWEFAMARAVEVIALWPDELKSRDDVVDETLRLTKRIYIESAKQQRDADQAIENQKFSL